MKAEELLKIKETVDGQPVKDLRWLPTDNVITGLVKDPILGKPHINDGFVSGMWRSSGIATNRIKGRSELNLKIPTD